jgi:hypothetical protein
LLNRGREYAIAAGAASPNEAQCIAAGFYVAALRDPMTPDRLSEADCLALVRLAIFDLGPSDKRIDPAVRRLVEDRLLGYIAKHLDDNTEEFRRAFLEHRDDLIHRISKQRKHGGPIDRKLVRQILLDLTFQARRYVGDCVAVQMQHFARALSEPMLPRERAIFDLLYARQAWLGGLPLVLVRDRFPFLQTAVLDLMMNSDDRRRVGALLRLLDYYGEMLGKRRSADRRQKSNRKGLNKAGQSTLMSELDDNVSTASAATDGEEFLDIAERLRINRLITCQCGDKASWEPRVREFGSGDDYCLIEFTCTRCLHDESVRVSLMDLRQMKF